MYAPAVDLVHKIAYTTYPIAPFNPPREKFTNFELAARVPLIIRAPALASPPGVTPLSGRGLGVAVHDLVELVDVMPTIIELATPGGYPAPPSDLEGTSLVPLMAASIGRTNGIVRPKTVSLTQFPR